MAESNGAGRLLAQDLARQRDDINLAYWRERIASVTKDGYGNLKLDPGRFSRNVMAILAEDGFHFHQVRTELSVCWRDCPSKPLTMEMVRAEAIAKESPCCCVLV